MKKSQFISIISAVLILLAVALSFLIYNIIGLVTAEDQPNKYSYTKAICENGFCQDYIIECNGTEILNQEPITGASMAIPNGWEDPRPEALINGFCNISDL